MFVQIFLDMIQIILFILANKLHTHTHTHAIYSARVLIIMKVLEKN